MQVSRKAPCCTVPYELGSMLYIKPGKVAQLGHNLPAALSQLLGANQMVCVMLGDLQLDVLEQLHKDG
jgi:hypothetical protein